MKTGLIHFSLALCALGIANAKAGAPATAKKPVTDTYHSSKVTEDYRWLENWDDPEVKSWTEAQNKVTRAFLDSIPQRAAIKDELWRLLGDNSPSYYGLQYSHGKLFAMKSQPPNEQPYLVLFNSETKLAGERVLI